MSSNNLYHDELIDKYDLKVLEHTGDTVILSPNPFFPEGGGQPADKGEITINDNLEKFFVVGVKSVGGKVRIYLDHTLPGQINEVTACVDRHTREIHSRLHTALHILNALVFDKFGAQVTGAQIHSDGTGRMDFNLPDISNSALRELEVPLNELVNANLPVKTFLLAKNEAMKLPGMQRTMNRSIPSGPDGKVRVVEIDGLDQQACGGTHTLSTGQVGKVAITKVTNKGRGNRRVLIKLVA